METAIFGVNQFSLLLGRALTLAEFPVVGVYDQDVERALTAALFLGTSALTSLEQLKQVQTQLLICASKPDQNLLDAMTFDTRLDLYGEETGACSLLPSEDLGQEMPLQITSELPKVVATLTAPEPKRSELENLFQTAWPGLL